MVITQLNPVACPWASLYIMSQYNEHMYRCVDLACKVMQPIVSLPLPPFCSVLECTICLSLAMTIHETRSMHEMNRASAVTVRVQQAECW